MRKIAVIYALHRKAIGFPSTLEIWAGKGAEEIANDLVVNAAAPRAEHTWNTYEMNIAFLSGSGLAIFAVYMLNHAIANYRRADASLTWPSVNGRLTDVRLWGKRNIGGEMKPADKLAVEYIYELNGKKYTGRSPTFYTLVYPRTVEFAERYSSREEVEVHYNPNEPSESVLTPGLNPDKPHSDLILGALAIVAGVSIAILGWLKIIG